MIEPIRAQQTDDEPRAKKIEHDDPHLDRPKGSPGIRRDTKEQLACRRVDRWQVSVVDSRPVPLDSDGHVGWYCIGRESIGINARFLYSPVPHVPMDVIG